MFFSNCLYIAIANAVHNNGLHMNVRQVLYDHITRPENYQRFAATYVRSEVPEESKLIGQRLFER